jgi:hypothetical protein
MTSHESTNEIVAPPEPFEFAELSQEEQSEGTPRHAALVAKLRRIAWKVLDSADLTDAKVICPLYFAAMRLRQADTEMVCDPAKLGKMHAAFQTEMDPSERKGD